MNPSKIVKIPKNHIPTDIIKHAGQLIKAGELVVFPTETVYGLGANALDAVAVKKIFTAKGRPSDNPLIVHIADITDLSQVAYAPRGYALKLAKQFWPGPLTLVLRKKKMIPEEVTAGLQSVAVRCPCHPIALALIRAAGVPIAAPSANRAGSPSPTTVKHAYADLKNQVKLFLDAGPTAIGVESTVVDCTGQRPIILRPGGLAKEEIEKFLGIICGLRQSKKITIAKSPGMKYRHYAPAAKVILVSGDDIAVRQKIQRQIKLHQSKHQTVGVLASLEHKVNYSGADLIITLGRQTDTKTAARRLFAALRAMDQKGMTVILVESWPEHGLGLAVMNRLRKAASKVI